jgi:hypothetical protein
MGIAEHIIPVLFWDIVPVRGSRSAAEGGSGWGCSGDDIVPVLFREAIS